MNKALGLPDNVMMMLADADQKNGFPAGTMHSIMRQEVGGNADKYLKDPAAYHYAQGADGRRVAKHTGKVSTAFGPFGILESTGAKPGYGVTPLKDKTLAEQVRFAGDYLAARSKQAGGLQAGIAGYGEGEKYAQQVASRIPGGKGVPFKENALKQIPPVMLASAAPQQQQMTVPQQVAQMAQAQALPVAAPVQQVVAQQGVPQEAQGPQGPDPWQEFLANSRPQVSPQELAYAQQAIPEMNTPDFMAALASMGAAPEVNFTPFGAMKGRV